MSGPGGHPFHNPAMMQLMAGMAHMMAAGHPGAPPVPGLTLLTPTAAASSSASGVAASASASSAPPPSESSPAPSHRVAPSESPASSTTAVTPSSGSGSAPFAAGPTDLMSVLSMLGIPGAAPSPNPAAPTGTLALPAPATTGAAGAESESARKKARRGDPDNRVGNPRFLTYCSDHIKKCELIISEFTLLLECDCTPAFAAEVGNIHIGLGPARAKVQARENARRAAFGTSRASGIVLWESAGGVWIMC